MANTLKPEKSKDMYLLGFDIGSSSIKAAIVDAESQKTVAVCKYPETEMEMISLQPGWAEQDPNWWWECVCKVSNCLLEKTGIDSQDIKSIGIAYQMHGLVMVDQDLKPLRPSIIWCDSRAVEIGNHAEDSLGREFCAQHLLNSPGNFTASKLKWVRDNESEVYRKAFKIMLPGDFIASQMTGEAQTSISGLSEGIFWDFSEGRVSSELIEFYELNPELIPKITDTFSVQGKLSLSAAKKMGLTSGIAVSYRAGDQPNNALSLGVLENGEFAGTGGTSGVIYGVTDQLIGDLESRVNSFAHVNYSIAHPKIGVLLCINGTGIMYNWMRQMAGPQGVSYPELEEMATKVSVGSDGLSILPFGNGAERMLNNRNIGAHISGLQLNMHKRPQLIRATLEGIAFAFVYGTQAMKSMGMHIHKIRVGNDNLFQSAIFSKTIASLLDVEIEMVSTTGAVGAAIGSGYGAGVYNSLKEAFSRLPKVKSFHPEEQNDLLEISFEKWKSLLQKYI